jgi:hypothetical protein
LALLKGGEREAPSIVNEDEGEDTSREDHDGLPGTGLHHVDGREFKFLRDAHADPTRAE